MDPNCLPSGNADCQISGNSEHSEQPCLCMLIAQNWQVAPLAWDGVNGEMTERISRAEKMRRIIRQQREQLAADRRKRPHLFVQPGDDILYVENVAELLGCSVDYVRRIPRRELPAARCGPRLQFLREDVIAFLRRRRDLGQGRKVDLRTPSSSPTAAIDAAEFDIVARTRAKLEKAKK